jgi:serine/threonine protein kinase
MKVVRTFKNDPHPSIIPFHSFIITPSYALITMWVLFACAAACARWGKCACSDLSLLLREYLPELVPVEVPEHKAKEWFQSLLSGVRFLHSRGVVHNDLK